MVKPFEKEDPFEMMAIEIIGIDALIQQTHTMAEEYRDMGMDKDELLSMFSNKFYSGMNMAYSQLGRTAIEKIIDQVFSKIRLINVQE
ncbi:MAG TPA: hypothetical protein QF698_00815 [Candidatus Marinimicrobia bacterium]|nr:hypothetical protein [Candidatus Neomarinimicrobiota bacterium]